MNGNPDPREDDDVLTDLAGSILDGSNIDWRALESTASEAQRAMIRELHLLAQVTALHQSLPAASTLVLPVETESDEPPEYWGHLKIIERIGRGTFGDVFRAWDSRLDRQVALKLVVAPTDAGSRTASTPSSIIEEGRLLARVRHPNVVTVYGAERIGARIGIWTELIEGRTLEDVVRHDGSLDAGEAAAIGADVCRALSAVHAAGLVHGDIKAQNVMREDGGRIVVMDFGAGRTQFGARSRDVAGTPLYLAPERFDGGDATPASDIYSVGVLLFYLVTGSYPVVAPTLDAVRAAHSTGKRRSLAGEGRPLPDRFVAAVERALDVDPSQRYPTAHALEAALIRDHAAPSRRARAWRLAIAAAIVVLIGALDIGGFRRLWSNHADPGGAAGAARPAQRLAVLPFADDGGGADSEMIAEGLTEDLISELNAVEGVRVISMASAFSFRRSALPLRDIGARLNVQLLLTGTLRRSDQMIVVDARLVRLPEERVLWRQTYTRPGNAILSVTTDLASGVVQTLRLPASRAGRQWPTDNVEAYALYQRGRSAWAGRTAGGARTALQLFERAATLDPQFAEAHAGIAMAYFQLADVGQAMSAEEAYPKVAAAAARALSLDPGLPEAHLAASDVKVYERDFQAVERARRRAVELAPSNVLVREQYGLFLSLIGRFSEAIDHVRVAQSLDPLSPRATWAVATVLRYARRYDEAITEARRVLELDPNYGAAYHTLGLCYQATGRLDAAIAAYLRSGRSGGNLGHAYAVAGRTTDAQSILAELEARYSQVGHAGQIAQIYIGLGDHERALSWLSRAAARMPSQVPTWKVAEIWDPLRSDPRFAALLTSVGLGEANTGAK